MTKGPQSTSFYEDICKLPTTGDPHHSFEATIEKLSSMDRDRFSVELSMGVDKALRALFDARNVPDDLFKAHDLSFPNAKQSLNDHYEEMLGRGEGSMIGFVSNLKGKVAELKSVSILKSYFPERDFTIHSNPTEPVTDITGIGPPGSEDLPVQIKMGGVNYAPDVTDRMEEHSNVLFGVSSELYDKISESRPDLSQKLLDLGIQNSDLTEDIRHKLEILSGNKGFDVPDSLGDILSWAGPVIAGIKILINIVMVERDYNEVELDERARIHALTALLLMSRYGVLTVCTALGSALGTAIPGPGNVAGSIGGAGVSYYVNKKIGPKMHQLATQLVNIDEEELFYLKNKADIDKIGVSFATTNLRYI